MNIAKFDLYNAEWLDLVFDHRNKEYGAYDLRKHYGSNMAKAMGITFAVVGVLVIASIVFKPAIDHTRKIDVDLSPTVIDPPPIKVEPKKTEAPKSSEPVKPAEIVKSTAIPTHIVPYDPPVDPPINAKIEGPISSTNTSGPATGGDNLMDKGTGTNTGTGVAPVDDGLHTMGEPLEFMPEPVGGAAAWGKFLQRNLRFPPVAQEQGVSGRVFLSFIIEKNGELSNIKVEKGAGYGFDEEALRVLKLAKAWKPGIQNGQPVRVRYTIPINFQLSE